jgi:membrane protein YqaA with SNARE-associated domain
VGSRLKVQFVRADSRPSPLYVRIIRHTASAASPIIAFAWGLAEATLFFVIPDVYLCFVALFDWRRSILATAATVAGALLGGTIMFTLAMSHGPDMDQLIDRVPLISPKLIQTVSEEMHDKGLSAMVNGPKQGIPYKVYAVQAGQRMYPIVSFLFYTVLARLTRILPLTLFYAAIGIVLKRVIQRRTRLAIGAYALVWISIYISYYLRFR